MKCKIKKKLFFAEKERNEENFFLFFLFGFNHASTMVVVSKYIYIYFELRQSTTADDVYQSELNNINATSRHGFAVTIKDLLITAKSLS